MSEVESTQPPPAPEAIVEDASEEDQVREGRVKNVAFFLKGAII